MAQGSAGLMLRGGGAAAGVGCGGALMAGLSVMRWFTPEKSRVENKERERNFLFGIKKQKTFIQWAGAHCHRRVRPEPKLPKFFCFFLFTKRRFFGYHAY
jgi:hypothetical protein